MNRAVPVAGAITLMLAVGGCASHSTASAPLSADSARILQADTLVLARLSSAQDWAGVRSALGALRADLSAARSQGTVSPDRAAAIAAQAAAVEAAIPPPPTPTPAQTTPQQAPTQPPPPSDKHGKDNGGQGSGGGGGD